MSDLGTKDRALQTCTEDHSGTFGEDTEIIHDLFLKAVKYLLILLNLCKICNNFHKLRLESYMNIKAPLINLPPTLRSTEYHFKRCNFAVLQQTTLLSATLF